MNKNNRNYLVDVLIGAAFLVAAVSAVAFLVPLSWIDFSITTVPTVFGVNYGVWQTLHKWGGIVMIVSALIHIALHWSWISAMTKKLLPKRKAGKAAS